MTQRKDLGIAIVGAGRIGALRAQLASAHPAVRFIAIADVDTSRARDLAQKVGAAFHSGDNLQAISRPEVDAVIVATSEGEHTAPVLQALERGKAKVRLRRWPICSAGRCRSCSPPCRPRCRT